MTCNQHGYRRKPLYCSGLYQSKTKEKNPNTFKKCFHSSWSLVVIKMVCLNCPLGANGPINSCNWVTWDNGSTFTKNNRIDLFFYCNHQTACSKVLIELYINLIWSYKKGDSMLIPNKPHTEKSEDNLIRITSTTYAGRITNKRKIVIICPVCM